MRKFLCSSFIKKGIALSASLLSFAAFGLSSLSASAHGTYYVGNENELKRAVRHQSSIIVTSDICLNSKLKIEESLDLNLNGHKIYPSTTYKDSDTIVVGNKNNSFPINVSMSNGFVYGVHGPIARSGHDDRFNYAMRNGCDGENGGCAINVIHSNLSLGSMSVFGGNGGNGGNGTEAKWRSIFSGNAGNGGNGGNGGNAISIRNQGTVNANIVYMGGGTGGNGGNGGNSTVGGSCLSGNGGNGGNAGSAVRVKNGTFNSIYSVKLFGGNGGNGGICGYSSYLYGVGGNGGNGGGAISYSKSGFHSNTQSASICGGYGGCGVIPGYNGEQIVYKR